jgi:kynurenine formamidase
MIQQTLNLLNNLKTYDLSQAYTVGMPHHPAHPPFLFCMSKTHGDYVLPGNASSAAEVITLGGHVGTHIDALCHFSKDGKLHGGLEVSSIQSHRQGIGQLSIDGVQPILRRGVLLDVAGHAGMEVLPADFAIGEGALRDCARSQNVQLAKGDVVLIRTGWARYWSDSRKYINGTVLPGPDLEGARWLSSHGIFAAGSDTIAFEFLPSAGMPVHVHLLVEQGIHIMEACDLEKLAEDGIYEFLFVAVPLKLRGATGSPIRPIALAASQTNVNRAV